jgi:hypothetical protein
MRSVVLLIPVYRIHTFPAAITSALLVHLTLSRLNQIFLWGSLFRYYTHFNFEETSNLFTGDMSSVPPAPNAASIAPNNTGIDLSTAVGILSLRLEKQPPSNIEQNSGESNDDNVSNKVINRTTETGGCVCCQVARNDASVLSSMNTISPSQGQFVDLCTTLDGNDEHERNSDMEHSAKTDRKENEVDALLQEKQKEQRDAQQRAIERQQELAIKLQSMSVKDIIFTVFHTQEGRVQAYRFYDEYVSCRAVVTCEFQTRCN